MKIDYNMLVVKFTASLLLNFPCACRSITEQTLRLSKVVHQGRATASHTVSYPLLNIWLVLVTIPSPTQFIVYEENLCRDYTTFMTRFKGLYVC